MPDTADAERALAAADEAFGRLDVEAAIAHLSAAIRGFAAAGDQCRAAMACVRLGDAFANFLGNRTASRAWFTRARRLVNDQPPCVEQGWVAVAAMGCDVDDPAELLASADLALARARQFGDVNLETKALADGGLARVQAGRVAEGMALLDEAMALACGPVDDPATAAKSVCSFFTACYFAADFVRADSWTDALRRQGLISLNRGGPVFLSSHCDSVQAALLVELGRWGDAEALLERSRANFESVMAMSSWHPDIALASLRVRQGRLADAESLLVGKDHALEALLPAARLHLARGDTDLARAAAQRGLRVMGTDRLRAVELLTVLVDGALAEGDLVAAAAVCAELADRVADVDVAPVQARSSAAVARVLAASGDLAGAVSSLQAALDRLDDHQLPWLRAMLQVELARCRDATGDRAGAILDAKSAASALATLDVVLAPPDAALLDQLLGDPPRRPRAGRSAVLARAVKGWLATCDGHGVRLQDTKGLRYLAELVAQPGREQHALDLVDRIEGIDPGHLDRRALGDAGPLLDARARSAYRHEIERLRVDIDDALGEDRLDAAEALEAEMDQLVAQLAQAFGLGGRDRPAASAAERARLNVTRALRSAIAKVGEVLPDAGAVLDRRVRTGMYCAYEPAADDEVTWAFSPD